MPSLRCFSDIRETFLYYRNAAHAPLICLCKVETAEHITGYGWALTAASDNPCYATARFLAGGRARAALHRGTLLDTGMRPVTVLMYHRPIQRPEACDTIEACGATGLQRLVDYGDWRALPPWMQPEGLREEPTL